MHLQNASSDLEQHGLDEGEDEEHVRVTPVMRRFLTLNRSFCQYQQSDGAQVRQHGVLLLREEPGAEEQCHNQTQKDHDVSDGSRFVAISGCCLFVKGMKGGNRNIHRPETQVQAFVLRNIVAIDGRLHGVLQSYLKRMSHVGRETSPTHHHDRKESTIVHRCCLPRCGTPVRMWYSRRTRPSQNTESMRCRGRRHPCSTPFDFLCVR